MRISHLSLKNVGPFKEGELDFRLGNEHAPITLITGENGTGKTTILDAVRGMFGHDFCTLERNIQRVGEKIEITMHVAISEGSTTKTTNVYCNNVQDNNLLTINNPSWLNNILFKIGQKANIVLDYWRTSLDHGSHKIKNLTAQNHTEYLHSSLSGVYTNARIVELICHFDYLRDSQDPRERETGKVLFEVLEKIVQKSLVNGKFGYVMRSTLTPVIIENGQEVNLDHLSSGNMYFIQRLIGLLGKMHSVHFLRKTPPEDLCKTPGVLLIDEIETHLHPKWQKKFLPTIQEIFPNLQIIATTHSPFIVASTENAKIYVCKSKNDHCIIADETAVYSNMPVDEILISPLFGETQPFNQEISDLLEKRKKAVLSGDQETKNAVEKQLKELNPDYFSYFEVNEMMAKLGGKK